MAKEIKIDENKRKALESAVAQIEKAYGKGSVMKLGDNTHMNVETFPTGSLGLDLALGVGGNPKGRAVEIYGPEGGGKTTVALHIVAEVQKLGGIAGFIDAEHALDPVYAKRIGVDIDNLYISQPDNGEQALEITETMVRSGAIDIIIVDSVAALVPKAEIEGDMGDSHVGLQARLMSQALRKLTGIIGKTSCTVIFINQLREKVGVMFGNPETTTGGRALKYYSSVRLEVRRGEVIKKDGEAIGNRAKIKVVKNKVAPPFREAEVDLVYGIGISREGDILDLAANDNIVNKSGAWYAYNGNKIGQGRENAKQYLKENPDIMKEIEDKVRAKRIPKGDALDEASEENVDNETAAPAVDADKGSAGAVEGAVDYVKSFHYLDDYRYAVHFVELHYEQRSRQRMRQDLYQRHVPEEYIDLALESICENDDVALQEALRKITKGETEYSYEEKQKIAGKLYRKGFRLGDIKRVLDM